MHPLAGLLVAGHGYLERRGVPDIPGLLGQIHLFGGQSLAIPGAKGLVGGRRGVARHAKQLGEADVVLPQSLALAIAEGLDQQLVEDLGRVGHHRDRPQHEIGVERRVGRPGWERPGVLG